MENYKMWIDNKWVPAVSEETYTVVNPATEEEIALVPKGDERDVDLAVKAARKAFTGWAAQHPAARADLVNRLAELLKNEIWDIVEIDTLDHGTPSGIAYILGAVSAGYLEYNALAIKSLTTNVLPVHPDNFYYLRREPLGVCALITRWNVPLTMAWIKLGPALCAGNTCVVKPPSCDSLATLKFAELIEKAGFPPGVVNIVTGPGGKVGNALAAHPDVNLISFTGSSETGKQIMATGSTTMKRMILELGGKNPFIVLDDADLEAAVQKAVACSYTNSGMVCHSPGRYYISEKKYDEFVDRFVAIAQKLVTGDPKDVKTDMGPLVSAEHRDTVEKYIKSGLDEGARLVMGGKRPTEPPMDRGYYVVPTAFTDVTNGMTIAREEIFGPVACMLKYTAEEEVIKLANDNIYGLAASVWTKDLFKAQRFANNLNAGTVYVNTHGGVPAEMPWGGFKESGIGKENGVMGLEGYTQVKVIQLV